MKKSQTEKLVESLSDLSSLTDELVPRLPRQLIVLLQGEPGAGKTNFVKQFVSSLAGSTLPEVEVVSPTFALHQVYEVKTGGGARLSVDHWDLYRLESEDDLESSGFWDQFSRDEYLVFVEWPERLREDWLPQKIPLWKVSIENLGGTQRKFSLEIRQN